MRGIQVGGVVLAGYTCVSFVKPATAIAADPKVVVPPGATDPPVVADSHIVWTPYDGKRIQAEGKRGRPVFLDFTAEWCATCKANEHAFLETDTVRGVLTQTNILPMRADMTNDNDELSAMLESLGRTGIPAYVIIMPDGTRDLLPITITADMVAGHLETASHKYPSEKFARN